MDKEASRKTLNMVDVSSSQPTLGVNPTYPEMNLGDPPVMTEPMPVIFIYFFNNHYNYVFNKVFF